MGKEYAYSEIFHSIQGEGQYTGVPSIWLRFFLCNLQCDGFGQKDPTNPDTYKLPYKEIKIEDYNKLEDLPVFETGCDSSYSWSKKFKHLQHKKTAEELASSLRDSMTNEYNPDGKFGNNHMVFTGGEPMMKTAQKATVEVLSQFDSQGDTPSSVTFETNGTQKLTEEFLDYWKDQDKELFFSISPKLYNTSGETTNKAINISVLKSYHNLSSNGQLKFVVNGTKETWEELETLLKELRQMNIDYPVWIMPVGATIEGQDLVAAEVATEAFKRGYNVSSRVHTYLFGNIIGV